MLRSIASGPNTPISNKIDAQADEIEEFFYTMEELGCALDNYLKLIIPLWYAIYLWQTLPSGSLNTKKTKS
jgi:hypothetical protein